MSTTLNGAVGSAKDVIDSAKGSAEHAASAAKSTFLDVAKLAVSAFSTLKGFDRDDALGLIGLSRRRGGLESAAIFGAGVAVGAGIGVFFAPMSGRALRRGLLRAMDELKTDAGEKLEKVGNEAMDMERKVEKKVGSAADAVKSTISAAEEGVKDAMSDARSGGSSKSQAQGGTNGNEGAKASKTHGGSESGRNVS